MFGRRKDSAKISDRSPVFHVRYIGSTETHIANGTGCSYKPVQRLWDNAPQEKHLRKVAVRIDPWGISLQDDDRRDDVDVSKTFPIENVSFCNVDRAVNERIFSWISRSEPQKQLHCYAVLCSSSQKAQSMAVVLSRTFHIAYKDWRTQHRSSSSHTHSPRSAAAGGTNSKSDTGNGSSVAAGMSTSSLTSHYAVTSPYAVTSQKPSQTSGSASYASIYDEIPMASDAQGTPTSSVREDPFSTSAFQTSSIWDPDGPDTYCGVGSEDARAHVRGGDVD